MIFQVLFIQLPRQIYNYLPLHQYNGMSRIRTAVKDVLSLKPTLGGAGDLVSEREPVIAGYERTINCFVSNHIK